jgi:hypothetical protein
MGLTNLSGWGVEYLEHLARSKFIRVAGANANTNIAISGITTKDNVVLCYNETDGDHVHVPADTAKATGIGTLDTVFEITTAGAQGNDWALIQQVGAAASVAVDLAFQRVTITFVDGVTTVSDVEALVGALSGASDVVGRASAGTPATVLAAATDVGVVMFAGGTPATPARARVTSAGNVQFPFSTSGKNIIVGYEKNT